MNKSKALGAFFSAYKVVPNSSARPWAESSTAAVKMNTAAPSTLKYRASCLRDVFFMIALFCFIVTTKLTIILIHNTINNKKFALVFFCLICKHLFPYSGHHAPIGK